MTDTHHCGAVLLAGGRSRRMGRDKAELTIGGEPMLIRLSFQLAAFDERLLSVASDSIQSLPGFRTVRDQYPGAGPMAGLHAALTATAAEALLTVPCDLPNFTAEAAQVLLSAFPPEADAMVCRDSTGRLHPLSGIYSRRCLPVMERNLSAGHYQMRDLLRSINCAVLDTAPLLPDETFFTMNTPADYQKIQDLGLDMVGDC